MDGRMFLKPVCYKNPNPVALDRLDGWAGRAAIIAPAGRL